MKRGMITGLIIVSLFSLAGCNESSKEVVIENRDQKEEIVLEKIKNEKNETYYLENYINGEYYLLKEKENGGYEENFYKVNRDNEFEKTNKEFLPNRYEKESVEFVENEKDSPITKVRYINSDMDKEEIIDVNFGDEIISEIYMIHGKEKTAYTNQKNMRNKNIVKIVDLKSNKAKKIDYEFEDYIRSVIYADSYYVLDDKNFKLYKLKEEDECFKVEEMIDLMKEFNVKPADHIFYVGRIFLDENGDLYLEGIDNNRNVDHTNSCGQALFKYNLKTKEKARINYNFEKDMDIADYNLKSGYIVLESLVSIDTRISKEKLYIGKISNDKVEIIEEIKIQKSDDSVIQNVEAMFNDEGNEVLISYIRVENNKRLNEYLKVKIE